MKTFSLKKSEIKKGWYLIDATDLVLGRMASIVSLYLRGKHKPDYSPNMDCGDHIVVINADKVHLTGNKLRDKVYYRHTGYPGGIKEQTAKEIMRGPRPEKLILKAVERMLGKGPLGRQQLTNLRVYAGAQHQHEAQKPKVLDIAQMNRKNRKL